MYLPLCLWQVGCMPWLWSSTNTNSSIIIIDVDSGANHTMAELPCDGASYAFLSCVVGTLTLALFLRVSWLPKMALMLLLGVLYVTVLELSGFRKTAGWGSQHNMTTNTRHTQSWKTLICNFYFGHLLNLHDPDPVMIVRHSNIELGISVTVFCMFD